MQHRFLELHNNVRRGKLYIPEIGKPIDSTRLQCGGVEDWAGIWWPYIHTGAAFYTPGVAAAKQLIQHWRSMIIPCAKCSKHWPEHVDQLERDGVAGDALVEGGPLYSTHLLMAWTVRVHNATLPPGARHMTVEEAEFVYSRPAQLSAATRATTACLLGAYQKKQEAAVCAPLQYPFLPPDAAWSSLGTAVHAATAGTPTGCTACSAKSSRNTFVIGICIACFVAVLITFVVVFMNTRPKEARAVPRKVKVAAVHTTT